MIKDIYPILIVYGILACLRGKQIQLPTVHDTNSVMLKMGISKTINQPDIIFQKVYRREVEKIDAHAIYRFAPCWPNKAEIQFKVMENIKIEGVPQQPQITINFQDILYSQYLLDVYLDQTSENTSNVYIMFKNKKVFIITLKQLTVTSNKMINVQINDGDMPFGLGYFIKLNEKILFVNNEYAIDIQPNKAIVLKQYSYTVDFETVIALQNNYFAVLGAQTGIVFYSYNDQKLQKLTRADRQMLTAGLQKQMRLKDMAYWKQKKLLIVVNSLSAVTAYQLSLLGNEVQLKKSNPIYSGKNCKLAYLYDTNLFLYCGGVMKSLKLDKWPKITQKILPYPQIQVRQIYKIGQITAFIGRHGFSILYLDSFVNYFQDKKINKLLLTKDFFLSVSEKQVKIGQYKISQPYVTCNTENPDFLGTTNLLFTTIAECNDEYFKRFRVNRTQLGQIEPDDVCKYTISKPINIWRSGQINYYPFIIGFAVLHIFLCKIACIQIGQKIRISRYKKLIQQYNQSKFSQSAKPQELAQEMDPSQKKISDKQLQAPNKESEAKLDGNLYEI